MHGDNFFFQWLQTGDVEELPTNKMMEKQRVVIDELKTKLDLNMDNFDKLRYCRCE